MRNIRRGQLTLSHARHAQTYSLAQRVQRNPIAMHTEKRMGSLTCQIVLGIVIFAAVITFLNTSLEDEEANNRRNFNKHALWNITQAISMIAMSWWFMLILAYCIQRNERAFGVAFAFFTVFLVWMQIIIFQNTMKSIRYNFGDDFHAQDGLSNNLTQDSTQTMFVGNMSLTNLTNSTQINQNMSMVNLTGDIQNLQNTTMTPSTNAEKQIIQNETNNAQAVGDLPAVKDSQNATVTSNITTNATQTNSTQAILGNQTMVNANSNVTVTDDKIVTYEDPAKFFGGFYSLSVPIIFLLTFIMLGTMIMTTFYILTQVTLVHNKYRIEVNYQCAQRNALLMNTMSHFPYSTFMASEARDCPICFEQFLPSSEVVQLKCNDRHVFHYECMEQYLTSLERREAYTGDDNRGRPCPLCRKEIVFSENPIKQLQ